MLCSDHVTIPARLAHPFSQGKVYFPLTFRLFISLIQRHLRKALLILIMTVL
jgi:hypothetical protein